jgi:hypothetical protein
MFQDPGVKYTDCDGKALLPVVGAVPQSANWLMSEVAPAPGFARDVVSVGCQADASTRSAPRPIKTSDAAMIKTSGKKMPGVVQTLLIKKTSSWLNYGATNYAYGLNRLECTPFSRRYPHCFTPVSTCRLEHREFRRPKEKNRVLLKNRLNAPPIHDTMPCSAG